MIQQNYNVIDGINFRAETKRFTHKMMKKKTGYFLWCEFHCFHLGQSGIETEVFLKYLSQWAFRFDESERFNLQNFTEALPEK